MLRRIRSKMHIIKCHWRYVLPVSMLKKAWRWRENWYISNMTIVPLEIYFFSKGRKQTNFGCKHYVPFHPWDVLNSLVIPWYPSGLVYIHCRLHVETSNMLTFCRSPWTDEPNQRTNSKSTTRLQRTKACLPPPWKGSRLLSLSLNNLVGGFNSISTIFVKLGSSSPIFGSENKTYLKAPSSYDEILVV